MFQTVAVLIPIFGIIFSAIVPVIIVWLVLRFRTQRNQLVYDTAVKLADKGQPVPAELFANLNPPGSDLRRGAISIAIGAGLSACLYEVGAPWTFGLIPLFMGVGFLIVWQLEKRGETKS